MSERPTRKTRRRPRRGSRRFDASCRNHGSCGWCKGNRTIANKRALGADPFFQPRPRAAEETR